MEFHRLGQIANLTQELCRPLQSTHRIKYTCYDVSKSYIVCGATSGSLYIFQREPCKFLQLIPNLSSVIVHVAISPQEQYIAFTTQKGTILIYLIDLTTVQPDIFSSYYHEMNITQIKWKQNEHQLFVGDMKGNVFLVNLNNFLGRNSINILIHPILFLESPIVQICVTEHLLLVSNYTKTILCNTDTEEFKQIGNQPRDGKFGACFYSDGNPNARSNWPKTRVVCARPGTRLWECTIDGKVLQTHKFKSALGSEEVTKITISDEYTDNAKQFIKHEINEQLNHLQSVNTYVLGHTSNAIYIFDLVHSNIVMWSNTFGPIHTVKVINSDTILVFTKDQRAYTFQLETLNDVDVNEKALIPTDVCNFEKKENIIDLINNDCHSRVILGSKSEEALLNHVESTIISQEDKDLQSLFLIYKSSRISKFILRDRYAEFFDKYDQHGVQRLLNALELLIIDNDSDITQLEAKINCASIYLNYMNIKSTDNLSPEAEQFIIDCFLLINSPLSTNASIKRCDQCNFPVLVPKQSVKHLDVVEMIVKRLVKCKKFEKLFDIIDFSPAIVGVLLKVIASEGSAEHGCEFETIINIFFCCTYTHVEPFVQSWDVFKSKQFWSEFLSRLIRLHNDNIIQCTRCKAHCEIDMEFAIETKSMYNFDYAFNKCINTTNGLTALELCMKAAKHIPCDALSKQFYMKCLLSS